MTTTCQYDGDSVLLEKRGGATTASYAYGNALLRKDGETPLFDGQGSERTVTNAGGGVQATLTLSAFGQTLASSGSSSDPYQYAATSRYRNDGDAGLALVGCRYYDAQVGQFITRDTWLNQKPYAYCDADPVNATDPDGHKPQGPTTKPKPPFKPNPPAWWPKKVVAQIEPGGVGGGFEWDGDEVWNRMTPPERKVIKDKDMLRKWLTNGGHL